MLVGASPTFKPSGNRCGHNPASPRSFEPPERHKARPGILRKLGEKLRSYYDSPAKILPSLNLANGKDSQQRSERREACVRLLSCLIHFLDLPTLRVGIPQQNGTFAGLTLPYLSNLSGLELRRAE
ncbi:MAG: replication protein RepA, partial [Nitrososphaera sp.]